MKTANLAIVFTELDGFAELSARQTHEQNQRLLEVHASLLTPLFRAFGGRVVKTLGASYLVTFESPTQAVLCGIAVQDRAWQHQRAEPESLPLRLKVAVNLGEVRLEGGDVFGEPVNIAARVLALTESGAVFFTEATYLAMNKAEVPAAEVGSFELKGIPGQVKVFRVPRAPYRVQSAAATEPGSPDNHDAPPYGNLGLSRVPDQPPSPAENLAATAAAISARAANLGDTLITRTEAALTSMGVRRRFTRLQWALFGLAAVILVAVALYSLLRDPVGVAIDKVARANTPEERDQREDDARRLILAETDPAKQSFDTGRLAEAMGQPVRAVREYRSAAKSGLGRAESKLIELLADPDCRTRSAAADAVGELKLSRARGALEDLFKNGGPNEGIDVPLLGCNSRRAAEDALRQLE